jgi:hypothetical protein
MSLVTALTNACDEIGIPAPSTFVSRSDDTSIIMLRLANKAATVIAKSHDWSALSSVRTFNAVASQVQVEPPSNYDRITSQTDIWNVSTRRQLYGVTDLNQWMNLQINTISGAEKYWMRIGGKFNFYPIPSVTEQFTYSYQKKNFARPFAAVDDTTDKNSFTLDTDLFLLDDELLTLSLIWRWKQAKELEYSEDKMIYDMELESRIASDRGPRMVSTSNVFRGDDIERNWNGVITP